MASSFTFSPFSPKVLIELLREDMLFIFTKNYKKKSHWLNSSLFPSNNNSTNGYSAWMSKCLQKASNSIYPLHLFSCPTSALTQWSHGAVQLPTPHTRTQPMNSQPARFRKGEGVQTPYRPAQPSFSLRHLCPEDHVRPTTMGIF